jgi:cystathionine beta-lyase/cystathionine gamma-synthase
MKTEIRKFIGAVSTLGLLASYAQAGPFEVQDDNTSVATQNASTFAYHGGIARRYENKARELQVKVEEHKKLLQHYEDKSYLYGRHGQEFQSHTEAVLRKYKLAAEKAATQAAFHHGMAGTEFSAITLLPPSLLHPLDNR